ncbi:MAG: ABC-F family ATP-binding cassette domain-containing protein [Eubacteriales bacterium]|nr:ABC-F family ATP-binding cassette domain-containing protein [Eubacteriales bacterium]
MACAYTFNQVTLFYSEKMLLDGVNLTISDGDRIGVVGRNGAGKSSLLRLLAGLEAPDRGDIAIRRNMSVAYLPQTPQLRPEDTITQAALTYLPARPGEDVNAAAYEAQTILTQLGFTDLNQPVGQLSGGQQMRVALAGVLCRESDVLLLDEPTNHIDLDMAQWLEDRLMQRKGTLIVVTHDRYLLERVFSRIFHVGGGRVDTFQTDYAGYLEERAQREEMEAATLRKNKSLYRKELAWIRRGAQARSTKAKGRIQRFDALTGAIREAPEEERLTMKSVASRLGKKILSWEHLDVAIGGNTLIRDFSYTLLRDDRLGVIGGNGAGKTTLLRTLCGEIPAAAGTIEQGDTVRIGYFAQHCPPMDPDMRIIDAVRDVAVKVYTPDGELSASQMAETFLFPSAMQYQKVSSLSGGEMRRLYLLRILMTAPNVLILDEPTNDLDLETLNVLEDYLDSFQGAIIAVSHDRYFLDRVTTHLFAMEDGRMMPYIGGYQSYLDAKAEAEAAAIPAPKPAEKSVPKAAPVRTNSYENRFTFREQRDFDTIEETIAGLEDELARLETELEANSSDYAKVTALMQAQQETQQKLEEAMDRWMYLQEKWERISQQKGDKA